MNALLSSTTGSTPGSTRGAAGARLGRRALRSVASHLLPRDLLAYRGPPAPRTGSAPGVGQARRAALTFDDGPDAMTGSYLDVLERHGVRATFFVVGEQCARFDDALVDMIHRGHEVAHHGYHHQRLPLLSRAAIHEELRRTAELLPPPRSALPMIRPPNGHLSARALLACAVAGYRTVLWSTDSDDCRTSDVEVVVERLAPGRVGDGEIILLHEGQGWTLAALPRVIEGLRGAGVELVTVGELLEGRGP